MYMREALCDREFSFMRTFKIKTRCGGQRRRKSLDGVVLGRRECRFLYEERHVREAEEFFWWGEQPVVDAHPLR